MGKVIVLTNLKGGVGKTTDTDLMAIVGSQYFNNKILLIDVDLQANSTQNMSRTFGIKNYPQSFTKAVETGSLKKAIVHLSPNLDFIAGSLGTHDLNEWIIDHSKSKLERYLFLKKMISEIKELYDYIFFDVAPSGDNSVDSIMMVSDYIVPVQEAKRFSMDGTSALINNYLTPMIENFPDYAHFQIAGILLAILNNRKKKQKENIDETIEKYGEENVFKTVLKFHERLERFGEYGISLNDYPDRKIWAIFCDFFSELESRIEYFEKNNDFTGFSYQSQYFDITNNRTLPLGKEIKLDGIITK